MPHWVTRRRNSRLACNTRANRSFSKSQVQPAKLLNQKQLKRRQATKVIIHWAAIVIIRLRAAVPKNQAPQKKQNRKTKDGPFVSSLQQELDLYLQAARILSLMLPAVKITTLTMPATIRLHYLPEWVLNLLKMKKDSSL